MSDNNKIVVNINNDLQLVAVMNDWNPDAKEFAEISVFIQEKTTGLVHQDIAIVGRNYKITDNGPELHDGISVKVYADENNEDFTNNFIIPIYKEPEAE